MCGVCVCVCNLSLESVKQTERSPNSPNQTRDTSAGHYVRDNGRRRVPCYRKLMDEAEAEAEAEAEKNSMMQNRVDFPLPKSIHFIERDSSPAVTLLYPGGHILDLCMPVWPTKEPFGSV